MKTLKTLVCSGLFILVTACIDTDRMDHFVQNDASRMIREQSRLVLQNRWFEVHHQMLANIKIQQELGVHRIQKYEGDLINLYAIKLGILNTSKSLEQFNGICDSKDFLDYFRVGDTLLDWPFANFEIPFEVSVTVGGDTSTTIFTALLGLFQAWDQQRAREDLQRISSNFNRKQMLPGELFRVSREICKEERAHFSLSYNETTQNQKHIDEYINAAIKNAGVSRIEATVQDSAEEIAKRHIHEIPVFDFDRNYQTLMDLVGSMGFRRKYFNRTALSLENIEEFELLEDLLRSATSLSRDLVNLYPHRKSEIDYFNPQIFQAQQVVQKKREELL